MLSFYCMLPFNLKSCNFLLFQLNWKFFAKRFFFWTPEVFVSVFKLLFKGILEFPEQPFETLRFIVGQQFHEHG